MKVQAISLEAMLIQAPVVISPRDKKRKELERVDGRQRQEPEKKEVMAQQAAGLELKQLFNKL